MIVFLQYTLTDLRGFTGLNEELLNKPSWPWPKPFKEFVRGTGQIIERRKNGLSGWVGENFICKIKNGIRPEVNNESKCKFLTGHLYASTRFALTKYEFVFKTLDGQKDFSCESLSKMINDLLNSHVVVTQASKEKENLTFNTFIDALKSFHIRNTTQNKSIPAHLARKELILGGALQVYCLLDRTENFRYRKNCFLNKQLYWQTGSFIYGGWLRGRDSSVRMWLHAPNTVASLIRENRSLRISLMRLHSESECLKNILGAINSNSLNVIPHSAVSDLLQKYFNKATATYLKQDLSMPDKLGNDLFRDEFSNLLSMFQPGELNHIAEEIKAFDFRPQIEKKVIKYIKVMGDNYENHNTVGPIGPNSKMVVKHFVQKNNQTISEVDFSELVKELAAIREKLPKEPQTSQDSKRLAVVLAAQEGAEEKDSKKVMKNLKAGGKWLLDFATQVTASVVAEMINRGGVLK